jgi:hypothetical protein
VSPSLARCNENAAARTFLNGARADGFEDSSNRRHAKA